MTYPKLETDSELIDRLLRENADLLFAAPAYAAPRCDALNYCVGSETRIWEQTYSVAFVYYAEEKGYDDNTAAGIAESVADRALKIYKQRHSR